MCMKATPEGCSPAAYTATRGRALSATATTSSTRSRRSNERTLHIMSISFKPLWFVLSLCLMLGGCMNLYTRCPGTDSRIHNCYQSTDMMVMVTVLSAFPQVVDISNTEGGLRWYNLFTVPLFGVPCLADTACEAAIDTVLWPIDYFRVNRR